MSEPKDTTEAADGQSHLTGVLAVNNVMVVEVYRADGSIIERYLGPSEEQFKYEHDAGQCGGFCGYCYQEAAEYLTANMELRGATDERK